MGKGANSLYIQAFLGSTISSNTCSIFDYIKYDDATTDKSSNYSLILNPQVGSLGYDSTNKRYSFNKSGSESSAVGVRVCSIPYTDCEVSVDFLTGSKSSPYNGYLWIGGASAQDWNNHCEIGTWSSAKVCGGIVNGNQSSRVTQNGALGTNTWYTFYAKFENGSCTTKIINPTNQTVITERTFTCFSMETMYIDIDVNGASSTNYFKNIKVISL